MLIITVCQTVCLHSDIVEIMLTIQCPICFGRQLFRIIHGIEASTYVLDSYRLMKVLMIMNENFV